jgi:uncharacterized MnhB-related membrane protein
MAFDVRFARRFLWLRLLRWSLVLGALYDLAFAAVLVVRPQLPARFLRLPLPGAPFYLAILAVVLAMLAALYLVAARDPRRYSGVVAVAIAGRIAGGVALAWAAWGSPDLAGLYPLAAADLGFGLATALCWWPLRA